MRLSNSLKKYILYVYFSSKCEDIWNMLLYVEVEFYQFYQVVSFDLPELSYMNPQWF